jgi:quercetin dioxygenase-like cupin family protein
MTNPKLTIAATAAIALLGGLWAAGALNAQPAGFKRVELQKQDLSAPGREAVVARAEFGPGGAVPKHTHPGEELSYVLEGQVVLEIEGKPPATIKAGEVFFVPSGVVHAAKNAGKAPAKVLGTYIIEKGKPLATPVK